MPTYYEMTRNPWRCTNTQLIGKGKSPDIKRVHLSGYGVYGNLSNDFDQCDTCGAGKGIDGMPGGDTAWGIGILLVLLIPIICALFSIK